MTIEPLFIIFVALILFAVVALGLSARSRARRLAFIDNYRWPPGLISRLHSHHPHLRGADSEKIALGLKQFFRAYLKSNYRQVAMPSQAADDLWHEFILYTKAYQTFCNQAFGRFLHHTPAVMLNRGAKTTNEGLRRVWWQSCREEGIDPRAPKALPLLFALDADLKIANGYIYSPDCEDLRRRGIAGTQCGGDFSSSSYDGGTDGLGDSSGNGSSSSSDGGDGGGDGGGGCGGGGD